MFSTNQGKLTGALEFQFWEALFVCRGRRRYFLAGMSTRDRTTPGMEIAAGRLAGLVDLPYEGYRESRIQAAVSRITAERATQSASGEETEGSHELAD